MLNGLIKCTKILIRKVSYIKSEDEISSSGVSILLYHCFEALGCDAHIFHHLLQLPHLLTFLTNFCFYTKWPFVTCLPELW